MPQAETPAKRVRIFSGMGVVRTYGTYVVLGEVIRVA